MIVHARRGGFTIVELLAVLAIMGLLMAILFPAYNAMKRSNRATSAENTITTGVVAARAYATRRLNGRFLDIPIQLPSGDILRSQSGQYSGVAILFTPSGEMRLVENVWHAQDKASAYLELKSPPQDGYDDIPDRAYIRLPEHTGVMGIRRGNRQGQSALVLLPPPFAVRFDANGYLVSRGDGENLDGSVYYDGDYDNRYEVTSDRARSRGSEWDAEVGRFTLPFEKIETVIGVLIYDQRDFADVAPALDVEYVAQDSSGLSGPVAWLLANGQQLFFSRYAGTLMR